MCVIWRTVRIMCMPNKKFSLIELLVVVAIIGILLSILLPSLQKSRKIAYRAVCASNLHQLGIGASLWSKDQDGKLPTWYRSGSNFTTYWLRNDGQYRGLGLLFEENLIDSAEVFYCPAHATFEDDILAFNGTGNTWGGNKVRSSFTARSLTNTTGMGDQIVDWRLIDYGDKTIYTDFVGVNKWTNGNVWIYWPHENDGFNRMNGDMSVKWVHPGATLTTAGTSTPSDAQLLLMYEELDD